MAQNFILIAVASALELVCWDHSFFKFIYGYLPLVNPDRVTQDEISTNLVRCR